MVVAGPQVAVPSQTPGSAGQAQRAHSTQPELRRLEALFLPVPLVAQTGPVSPAGMEISIT